MILSEDLMSAKEDKTKFRLYLNGKGADMNAARRAAASLRAGLPSRLGITAVNVGDPMYENQAAQADLCVPFSVRRDIPQHTVEGAVTKMFNGQSVYVAVRG